MLYFRFTSNAEEILKNFRGFPPRMAEGLRREMDKQNRFTAQHIARSRLSYPRASSPGMEGLRAITGTLRRGLLAGVTPAVNNGNMSITGGIGNRVKYAVVHEFGATIPPIGRVYPTHKQALAFMWRGKDCVFNSVNRKNPIHIPARAPVTK